MWLELKAIFCHHCKEYCASYMSWYPMYRKWHLLEKAELNIYFPNYLPAKFPGKLHYPRDYPKLLKQRKILFSSVWCKACAALVILFSKMPFGEKWLWGPLILSHQKRYWRLLENTTLAHFPTGETEVLNNHKPPSDGFRQDCIVTNSLKTCLKNV